MLKLTICDDRAVPSHERSYDCMAQLGVGGREIDSGALADRFPARFTGEESFAISEGMSVADDR